MFKKIVFGKILISLLVSIMTLGFNTQPVKASGPYYIRPNGDVDPDDGTILRNGDLYILTRNITSGYGIVVERNDILIDGRNCVVHGTGSGTGISLFHRNNVTIKNVTIEAFSYGILLNCSSNSIIAENSITANDLAGIKLLNSSNNNKIERNNLPSNFYGIWLQYASNNSISRNNLLNTLSAILLYSSSGNRITENEIIANHDCSIWIGNSSNNFVARNNIAANSLYGIWIVRSSESIIKENNIISNPCGVWSVHSLNNRFYHNSFINNTKHVDIFVDGKNIWDNGYPSGGNYWSHYSGIDLNHDGIGDTSYTIDANNTDHYPLMNPWVPLFGDVNEDRIIDIYDIVIAAMAFGARAEDSNWNEQADLYKDGIIDIFDLVTIGIHYGETWTP